MKTKDNAEDLVTWTGDLNTQEARDTFEPEIAMRIPDGSEFVNPQVSCLH